MESQGFAPERRAERASCARWGPGAKPLARIGTFRRCTNVQSVFAGSQRLSGKVWRHVSNVPFCRVFHHPARWKRAATGLSG